MIARALAAGLPLALAMTPAFAQDERPTGYPRSANERQERGFAISAVYTAEVRADVDGGIARGARYLDNIDLQLALDPERLIGWHGARAFVYVLRNNGVALSTSLVGDTQSVSNIETDVPATRIFEAWIEQRLGAASLKAGLYNLNSEFDTTESGGLFLLSSHGIGPDFSQSGRNGPSIFPVTSLALRGDVALGAHWRLRAAALDGVPGDPDHPARTVVKLSARDGALLTGEVNYLVGGTKAALGVWTYTAAFAPIGAPAASGHGNGGAYAFVEHRLVGARGDDAKGLAGWLRYGFADTRYNPIGRYLGGGLVYSGIGRRASDQLGLSVAAASFADRYRAAQAAEGLPVDSREVVVEVAYRAVFASWLSLQPDAQLVFNPGGDSRLRNALVFGLRAKIGR